MTLFNFLIINKFLSDTGIFTAAAAAAAAAAAVVGKVHSVQRLGYGFDDRNSFPGGGNDEIFFLFATASRPALEPTQPIKWVRGALSPGVKRPRREAYQPPSSRAEARNAWSYTSTP
jgi:hypothetical protein